jgi:hypothetical protein
LSVPYASSIAVAGGTYERNNFGGFRDEPVCKLFIEVDQIFDIDIAVEFFQQRILSQLVSAYKVSARSLWRL